MLKSARSQKIIMFSKDVGTLPDYNSNKNLMPVIEDDIIYPRVFPSQHMPLKVALARRIKAYQDFDLNAALKAVEWKKDKALLDLMYYNLELWASLE